MIASDLMTPHPLTVTPSTTIAEVSELMREHEIRHVPVVERGALVGIVSDRDLGYLNLSQLLSDRGVEAVRSHLTTPVIEVMSADVIVAEPETEIGEVVSLMLESKVGAIPVVRSGTREVVGIVSYVDVLRAVLDLLEQA